MFFVGVSENVNDDEKVSQSKSVKDIKIRREVEIKNSKKKFIEYTSNNYYKKSNHKK